MSNNIYQTENYRGYAIKVYYDEDAESPRTAWDNLGTMYTAHRRYRPEQEFDAHFTIDEVFPDGNWRGEFKKSFLKEYIALKIYLFDHSGQSVSTTPFSCPWDSGWFGIIAVPVESVKKEWNWQVLTKKRRERIEEILRAELETYNSWLHGEVYGYQIEFEDEDEENLDTCDDSCWGFYGDESLDEMIQQAKNAIDYTIDQQAKRLLEEEKKSLQRSCDFWSNLP